MRIPGSVLVALRRKVARPVLWALLLLAPVGAWARLPGPGVSDERPSVHRSASGLFLVQGPNAHENFLFAHWLESTAAKARDVSGLELARHARRKIVFELSETPGRRPGRIRLSMCPVAGRHVMRVQIGGLASVDYEELQAVLCRLLLALELRARTNGEHGWTERGGAGMLEAESGDRMLPRWLWEGLSQNLLPGLVARNMRLTGAEWRRGRLPALADVLGECGGADALGTGRAWRDLRRRSAHGAFMTWFLSWPGSRERWDAVLRRVGRSQPVSSAWLATRLPLSLAQMDLEHAWDRWLLDRERTVRQPGVLQPENAYVFQVNLECFTDHGVPVAYRQDENALWERLMVSSQEPWVQGLARNKAMEMRLLMTGRGRDIEVVAVRYMRFWDAVARGEEESRLRAKLAAAQTELRHLLRSAAGPPRPCEGEDSAEAKRSRKSGRTL